MSEPAAPAIATSGLTKDYGRGHGLFDLDLQVQTGEIFGFLGPNGAGKSTAIKLLLDLIRPSAGGASILGMAVPENSMDVRRRVGFLPSEFGYRPRMTGDQFLDHLSHLRGGVDRRHRDALAERLGADTTRRIRDLSSGNRQKIGLVQAFMHRPELVILDEPITGLDPLVQREFHTLIAEVRDAGGTVLLSSHTLSEVERVADRVGILRGGRLVVVDTIANLRGVAVQDLEITFDEPVDAGPFRDLAGVTEAYADGPRLRFVVEGSIDAVIAAAAAHRAVSIRSHEPDLEDVFLRYYRDDDPVERVAA